MSTMNLSVTVHRLRPAWRWTELKRLIVEWRRRARSRYELMNLGDETLRDIGLSRGEADLESSKPFWQR